MPSFHRFDRGDGTAATDDELRARWKTFHQAVRASSSSRVTRLVGPLLGEDTRRRRMAYALERLLRPSPMPTSRDAEVSLPWASLVRGPSIAPADAQSNVAFVVVDLDDLEGTHQRIDDAVRGASEWLMLVESDRQGEGALADLWPHRHGADVIFADEMGFLKTPLVGPHTLLSVNVVGRPALLRCEAIRMVGGCRPAAGVAFEHDLYLRLLEQEARFVHVPAILPGGRATHALPHPDLAAATVAVVEAAFERRGRQARVIATAIAGVVAWSPLLDTQSAIDIIIPTRDRVDLLRRCIESVEQRSTYTNYAITILDNDSVDPETLAYFAATPHRVIPCPGPFNYAAIMNRGVAATTAPFIVTLNNDTIIETPDWLEQLAGVCSMPAVALVGCRQVHGDGSHDHDGIVIAPYPQHLIVGRNWPRDEYLSVARRDCSAVTGAVTMVRRNAWDGVGGMDEDFAVVMNDVDLCLRLQNEGGAVVMVPDVVVRHDASSSRGRLDPLVDRNRFVRRWDIFGQFRDPYFPERLRLYGQRMVAVTGNEATEAP